MEHNFIGTDRILKKKKEFLLPCVYHFYTNPPQVVRGEMQYLFDSEGKRYVDFFAGVSVINCGHCNEEIVEKTIGQLKTLQHTTTIYLTQPIVELAEKLSKVTPSDLKKTFFCGTGTEANEGALLLAKLHTGKSEFLSMQGGLHGRSHLATSMTGIGMWRTDPNPVGGISFVPNPYCYRCPYKLENKTCAFECAKQVEKIIKMTTSGKIAAMIAEPIQGNGGIVTPPKGYFKALKTVLEKYEILLIIDEVQTGFARTGKMFAIEHYDVKPDIMTMAKALGNGVPIAAYTTTDAISSSFTRPSASTLGGNPVSATTGIAVLEYIEKNNLCQKAEKMGNKLKMGLLALKEKHSIIGDVRGIGLMLGAELIRTGKEPATKETDIIIEALKDKGFLIGKNGVYRNVLAFQPPLIITEENIDRLLEALDEVLEKIIRFY